MMKPRAVLRQHAANAQVPHLLAEADKDLGQGLDHIDRAFGWPELLCPQNGAHVYRDPCCNLNPKMGKFMTLRRGSVYWPLTDWHVEVILPGLWFFWRFNHVPWEPDGVSNIPNICMYICIYYVYRYLELLRCWWLPCQAHPIFLVDTAGISMRFSDDVPGAHEARQAVLSEWSLPQCVHIHIYIHIYTYIYIYVIERDYI